MDYPELKGKYGERIINRLATDIVVAGLHHLDEHWEGDRGSLDQLMLSALNDLQRAGWDNIRATIKRSL